MSSPGINHPLVHDARENALTFIHPNPTNDADQLSPTFTVSSSSSFTSLSSFNKNNQEKPSIEHPTAIIPSSNRYTRTHHTSTVTIPTTTTTTTTTTTRTTTPDTYMTTVNNLKEESPQSQCLFSYAELLTSQTTNLPSTDGYQHHHPHSDHNTNNNNHHPLPPHHQHHSNNNHQPSRTSYNHHHQQQQQQQQQQPHRETFTTTSTTSSPSFLSRPSQEPMNMLPPPPPVTSMTGLHPLNMPYSPSSPIARPLQQQQQNREPSFYDSFGYPYVGNSNTNNHPNNTRNNNNNNNNGTSNQGAGRDNNKPPRALNSPTSGIIQNYGHLCTSSSSSASSSSSRPVTPVSPLMSLSLETHESKNMYTHFRRATMHDISTHSHGPVAHNNNNNNNNNVRDHMWNPDYAKPAQQQQTTTSSNGTLPPPPPSQPRSRGRRVSNVPTHGVRMFTCQAEGCGKVFKRSEHLKRHIRSIHTLEKPFECPYQSCHKRFSRSDNLNQHIRIHRHSNAGIKEKKQRPGTNIRLDRHHHHPNNNNLSHSHPLLHHPHTETTTITTPPTGPSPSTNTNTPYHPFSNYCTL
ncbi:hypothetical protein INT45_003084 [Circinella minor]|uniref:C2H2-type domain-containing protein n=1 Tax=Circinella minor TaxID=1195481 RepID=A0A8H7VBF5_9FUNG|nr:hypothetical protein INT45_003084 [Circinella minor]